ncbi:MAG: DUF4179 domain-containing protein [Clostridiales bacterium]|jgi:hypothetical protein|nr:DUF4179 domain-containing protein [Clostridiales bacterium]
MNNNDWNSVFPEVPQRFHETVQCTLDTQILNNTGRKKVLKKRFPIVLAAVIAALGVTAAATAYIIQWNDKLAERFDANEEQQNQLVSDSAIASVDQTVTESGLTVTAVQTLGHKNGVYLLFDVKAPEGITLSDENLFEGTSVEIEGIENGANYSGGFLSDTNQNVSSPAGTNERYYEIWLSNTDQADWNGKKITVTFSNLQANNEKLDMYTELEGKWTLSWMLSYTDQAQTFEINQAYDIGGHEVFVKSIELSPLSMTIDLGGTGLEQLIEDAGLDELGTLFMPSLILYDGTTFQSFGGPGSENWTETEYTRTISFDKILDVDQLTGITLNFQSETSDNALTVSIP